MNNSHNSRAECATTCIILQQNFKTNLLLIHADTSVDSCTNVPKLIQCVEVFNLVEM